MTHGAAIVRPPSTEYTQSRPIGTYWGKLTKNSENNYCNFSLNSVIAIFHNTQNIFDGNSHNKIAKLQQIPFSRNSYIFACFH